MTGFVSVSPLVHRVLVLLGFVGLLSQSILVYFLEPLPRFQPLCRKILEGNILTLLILLESDLIMDIRLDRVEPYGAFFRLVLGVSLLVLALQQRKEKIGCPALCLAASVSLPFCDRGYPWEIGLALAALLVRDLELLPDTILEKRMQITEYSIQEAIDSLEEGVLISLAGGEPVLMNRALFRYTESVLGVGIRNGNVLWHLLQHVQEIQSRETLREIRTRIHDLMGMRISLLQQVLNNRDFADYQRIMPLLANMLRDVRQEIRVDPQVRLAELVSLYRKLGVLVTVRGSLPEGEWKGELCVQIIREALTNAICHGRASQVTLVLGENSLLVQDNGVGCTGPICPGGGLTGIREKVENRGGKLEVSGTPHFIVKIRFETEEKEGNDDDPYSAGG